MTSVLDACALIAFLKDEPGADKVEEILLRTEGKSVIHALNLCEVFYDLGREYSLERADDMLGTALLAEIEVNESLDRELWRQAGALKTQLRRISLADAFALSLAKRLDATLVTSDQKEFDPLVDRGICSIEFIR